MTQIEVIKKAYENAFASPKYENSVNRGMNQQYIIPAMDEWAKHQSLAFMKWHNENYYLLADGSVGTEMRSDEESYQLFLEHQKQQP